SRSWSVMASSSPFSCFVQARRSAASVCWSATGGIASLRFGFGAPAGAVGDDSGAAVLAPRLRAAGGLGGVEETVLGAAPAAVRVGRGRPVRGSGGDAIRGDALSVHIP